MSVAVAILVIAAVVIVQLVRPMPKITLRTSLPSTFTVGGARVNLPWPGAGQSAVAIENVGAMGSAGATSPQPIASLAKMMTALVVLRRHPLPVGESGPTLTMTAADVATYQHDLAGGQSVLQVAAGEKLTEQQLLQGMLIPSGNNIASLLATWDAGSMAAFVHRMNATARRLGMRDTHYADASGVQPGTVSTAADQLLVAEADMRIPAFRAIVAMPQATLPVANTVFNVNYFLGHGGIIGIKTGTTSESGGCYVAAAYRTVDGHQVLVLAAVLGQGGVQPLLAALNAGLNLINAAGRVLTITNAVKAGTIAGELIVPWSHPVQVRVPSTVPFVGWSHLSGTRRIIPSRTLGRSVRAGARVGTLRLTLGQQRATVPLKATAAIAPPPWWWRLTRV